MVHAAPSAIQFGVILLLPVVVEALALAPSQFFTSQLDIFWLLLFLQLIFSLLICKGGVEKDTMTCTPANLTFSQCGSIPEKCSLMGIAMIKQRHYDT